MDDIGKLIFVGSYTPLIQQSHIINICIADPYTLFFRKLLAVGDSFPHNNRILHCSHGFLLYSRLRSRC